MQNELALRAAEAITRLGLGNNVDENKQLDSNELIREEIEQKREESLIRKQIADDQLEADTFKTQLHFEETKQKLKLEKPLYPVFERAPADVSFPTHLSSRSGLGAFDSGWEKLGMQDLRFRLPQEILALLHHVESSQILDYPKILKCFSYLRCNSYPGL